MKFDICIFLIITNKTSQLIHHILYRPQIKGYVCNLKVSIIIILITFIIITHIIIIIMPWLCVIVGSLVLLSTCHSPRICLGPAQMSRRLNHPPVYTVLNLLLMQAKCTHGSELAVYQRRWRRVEGCLDRYQWIWRRFLPIISPAVCPWTKRAFKQRASAVVRSKEGWALSGVLYLNCTYQIEINLYLLDRERLDFSKYYSCRLINLTIFLNRLTVQ